MKFAVKLLVQEIMDPVRGQLLVPQMPARAQIPGVKELTVAVNDDREDALAVLGERLEPIVEMELVGVVGWSGGDGVVVCPEGVLDLPIDQWSCKVTQRRCPIQAQVWLDDHGRFRRGCDAPDKTKDGVVAAIESGYRGEHHLPGRYLCPLCPSRHSDRRRYRFPFELYHYPDVLNIGIDDDRRRLREVVVTKSFDIRVMSSAICAPCFLSAVESLTPPRLSEFAVVDVAAEV